VIGLPFIAMAPETANRPSCFRPQQRVRDRRNDRCADDADARSPGSVVAVWDRFVSAARPVGVTGAGNVRRTTHGIGSINRYGVLIDIYIPQRGFRFVIEVKRLQDEWSDEALQPFLRQTTAYQQTDVRLGFLAVLDLSDRPAGFLTWMSCKSLDLI
jgi:hypothetical protein